jgi:hypothetical protein
MYLTLLISRGMKNVDTKTVSLYDPLRLLRPAIYTVPTHINYYFFYPDSAGLVVEDVDGIGNGRRTA